MPRPLTASTIDEILRCLRGAISIGPNTPIKKTSVTERRQAPASKRRWRIRAALTGVEGTNFALFSTNATKSRSLFVRKRMGRKPRETDHLNTQIRFPRLRSERRTGAAMAIASEASIQPRYAAANLMRACAHGYFSRACCKSELLLRGAIDLMILLLHQNLPNLPLRTRPAPRIAEHARGNCGIVSFSLSSKPASRAFSEAFTGFGGRHRSR